MKNKFVENIGGVFIYSRNPQVLAEWYKKHLGIEYQKGEGAEIYYCGFYYKDIPKNKKAYLVWSVIENKNKPELSEKVFCINYRVSDIEKITSHLKKLKIDVKGIEIHPEGKFAWINDIEGNLIELWEDTNIK